MTSISANRADSARRLIVEKLSTKRCAIRITSQAPPFKNIDFHLMAAISTCEYAGYYRRLPQADIRKVVESIFSIARKSMAQILLWLESHEDKFVPGNYESTRMIRNLVILSQMLHDYGFDIEAEGFIRDAMVLEKLRRVN